MRAGRGTALATVSSFGDGGQGEEGGDGQGEAAQKHVNCPLGFGNLPGIGGRQGEDARDCVTATGTVP